MPTEYDNQNVHRFERFEWKQGDYEVWSLGLLWSRYYNVYKNTALVARHESFVDAVTGALKLEGEDHA